jgi:hypothetical protein
MAGPARIDHGIATLKRKMSSSGPAELLFRVSDHVM